MGPRCGVTAPPRTPLRLKSLAAHCALLCVLSVVVVVTERVPCRAAGAGSHWGRHLLEGRGTPANSPTGKTVSQWPLVTSSVCVPSQCLCHKTMRRRDLSFRQLRFATKTIYFKLQTKLTNGDLQRKGQYSISAPSCYPLSVREGALLRVVPRCSRQAIDLIKRFTFHKCTIKHLHISSIM